MYPANYDSLRSNLTDPDQTITGEVILLYSSPVIQSINVNNPIKTKINMPGYTEVTGSPVAGQYRILYKTTQILFGPIPVDTSTTITYTTTGSAITASHVNNIASSVNAIETTLGINPQGSYNSVADRLNAVVSNAALIPRKYKFTVSTPAGYYVISLPIAPAYPATALVFRGSELLDDTKDPNPEYSISGNFLTISDEVALEDLDIITVSFMA